MEGQTDVLGRSRVKLAKLTHQADPHFPVDVGEAKSLDFRCNQEKTLRGKVRRAAVAPKLLRRRRSSTLSSCHGV